MTSTPRGAPELGLSQAVPETTVNEQIRRTEAGAGRYPVADRVTAPPGTCADGANYIIIATATGAFNGKEGQIATAVGTNAASGWYYRELGAIDEGVLAYVQDEDAEYKWDGSAWVAYSASVSNETIDDRVASLLVAGSGITLTYNDAANTLTVDAAAGSGYTDEQVRDVMGTALVAGSNVTITVNDAGDTITIDATGGGGGTTDLSTEYTSTSPSTPGTGLTIFDRKRAGRHSLSAISPLSAWEVQRTLANRQIMLLQPQSSTPSTFGMNGGYSGNNGTMSTTNAATQERRVELATSGSAGTNKVNGFSVKFFWTTGGFFYSLRFGMPATFNAGFQWFMGLTDALSLTGDPSAKTNIIGFGVDAADSNIQFMVNDASGTATKTDLGANFPGKTTGCVYEMRLFCAPGGSTVYYSLERFDSAQFTEGSASSDLPTATTLLGEQFSIRNGAIASAATIAMMSFYAELG